MSKDPKWRIEDVRVAVDMELERKRRNRLGLTLPKAVVLRAMRHFKPKRKYGAMKHKMSNTVACERIRPFVRVLDGPPVPNELKTWQEAHEFMKTHRNDVVVAKPGEKRVKSGLPHISDCDTQAVFEAIQSGKYDEASITTRPPANRHGKAETLPETTYCSAIEALAAAGRCFMELEAIKGKQYADIRSAMREAISMGEDLLVSTGYWESKKKPNKKETKNDEGDQGVSDR